jgi:guanylate kinase
MAESAAGKDYLTQRLCKELGLNAVVSYTTRPPRNGEIGTHIFVDDSTYEEMKESGNIAAYTEINGYKYWTTIGQLYTNQIYIIDPNGLQTLEDLGLEDIDLCSIYINVPFEVRIERAIARGDGYEAFTNRTASELHQFVKMKAHGGFDWAVSNLNSDKAFEVLKKIIEVETAQN